MLKGTLLRRLGHLLALMIFGPLLLGLLFLVPADFLTASWHLARADSTTSAAVETSRVSQTRKTNARSDVTYRYHVDGTEYVGTRVKAGFLHRGFEGGGGDLAEQLRPGDSVTVHYSSTDPAFALLQYGWPKWSVAFPLLVWGIILQGSARHANPRHRPARPCLFVFATAMPLTAAVILVAGPPAIPPTASAKLVGLYTINLFVAAAYLRFRFRRHTTT